MFLAGDGGAIGGYDGIKPRVRGCEARGRLNLLILTGLPRWDLPRWNFLVFLTSYSAPRIAYTARPSADHLGR